MNAAISIATDLDETRPLPVTAPSSSTRRARMMQQQEQAAVNGHEHYSPATSDIPTSTLDEEDSINISMDHSMEQELYAEKRQQQSYNYSTQTLDFANSNSGVSDLDQTRIISPKASPTNVNVGGGEDEVTLLKKALRETEIKMGVSIQQQQQQHTYTSS